MSWFGGHFMKGYHLAAMLEFFSFYCKVENVLPDTHIISINSFSIFKITKHYHRIEVSYLYRYFQGEIKLFRKISINVFSNVVSMVTAPP